MSSYVFATGSDNRYFPGLLVSIVSALHASEKLRTSQVDIHILDGDISQKAWDLLTEKASVLNPDIRLIQHKVNLSHFKDAPKIYGDSLMTYARLWLPDLVKDSQVVYFDSDILMQHDLGDLYDQPFEDDVLVYACQDPMLYLRNDCKWLEDELKDNTEYKYFNSGIMKIDLDAWRRESKKEKAFKEVKENPECCARFNDQSVLNYLLRDHWKILDSTWNTDVYSRYHLHYEESDLLNINLHYILYRKPWLYYSNELSFKIWKIFIKRCLSDVPSWALKDRRYGSTFLKFWVDYLLANNLLIRKCFLGIYWTLGKSSGSLKRNTEYLYNYWKNCVQDDSDQISIDPKVEKSILKRFEQKYASIK